MKILYSLILLLAITCTTNFASAQDAASWNHKRCAVVLTYDDAINADLDNILPVLDSLKLTATFYLIGSSPVVNKRINEWRMAARKGNELGNHSLFHPCDGSLPGRSFVTPNSDLSKYTVERAVNEIKANNTLLKAIDGKDMRTFAYPCGDLKISGEYFYNGLKNEFAGARGVGSGMQTVNEVDLTNIDCYGINGQDADYMIGLVKKAMESGKLLVFLFHGVGGGHSINVALNAHSKLLHFLKQNEKSIWIAPMVDIAEYVKKHQEVKPDTKN